MKISLIVFLVATLTTESLKQPQVEFGLFEGENIKPSTQVPYQIGTVYGYRITFPKDLGKVTIKQEFVLPGSANWTGSHDQQDARIKGVSEQVSQDGSRLVSETQVDTLAVNEYFARFRIIEGDPAGPHKIRLWIDGKPLVTVEFDIVKPGS